MTHDQEIKLCEDVATIKERIENLPCRRAMPAFVGTTFTGIISAVAMSIYAIIGGQK